MRVGRKPHLRAERDFFLSLSLSLDRPIFPLQRQCETDQFQQNIQAIIWLFMCASVGSHGTAKDVFKNSFLSGASLLDLLRTSLLDAFLPYLISRKNVKEKKRRRQIISSWIG